MDLRMNGRLRDCELKKEQNYRTKNEWGRKKYWWEICINERSLDERVWERERERQGEGRGEKNRNSQIVKKRITEKKNNRGK